MKRMILAQTNSKSRNNIKARIRQEVQRSLIDIFRDSFGSLIDDYIKQYKVTYQNDILIIRIVVNLQQIDLMDVLHELEDNFNNHLWSSDSTISNVFKEVWKKKFDFEIDENTIVGSLDVSEYIDYYQEYKDKIKENMLSSVISFDSLDTYLDKLFSDENRQNIVQLKATITDVDKNQYVLLKSVNKDTPVFLRTYEKFSKTYRYMDE